MSVFFFFDTSVFIKKGVLICLTLNNLTMKNHSILNKISVKIILVLSIMLTVFLYYNNTSDKNPKPLSSKKNELSSSSSIRGVEKSRQRYLNGISEQLDAKGFIIPESEQLKHLDEIQKEKQNITLSPEWKPFEQNSLSNLEKRSKNKGLATLNRIHISKNNDEVVFAATNYAGLWMSNDGGQNWKDLTNTKIPVTSVWCVTDAPKKPNLILLGDKLSIYRTDDTGNTWTRVHETNSKVIDIIFNHKNSKKVYAATEKGVLYSKDAGITWSKVLDVKANAMRMHPFNSKVLYVSEIIEGEVKIWVTKNGGKSFTSNSLPDITKRNAGRTRMAVSAAMPSNIYLVTNNIESYGFGALYLSKDEGKTWDIIGSQTDGGPYSINKPNVLGYSENGDAAGGQLNYCFGFSVSQSNPLEIYISGIALWTSKDGGLTWENHSKWYPTKENKDKHLHPDIHDIIAYNNKIWVGHDGGLSYSNNKAETFSDRTEGINALEILGFDINFHNPNLIAASSMHVGSMFQNTNDFNGWLAMGGADDNYCGFGIVNDKHLIHGAGYQYNQYSWVDSSLEGKNIRTLSRKEPNGEISTHRTNHQILFQGLTKYNGTTDNNGSTLHRSTDFGQTWTEVLNDSLHSDDGRGYNARQYAAKSKVIACWNNPERLYYKNGSRIYESVDNGINWKIIYNFNTTLTEEQLKSRVHKSRILDLIVDPKNDDTIYVTTRGLLESPVLISKDGGKSWSDFSQGIPKGAGRANTIVYQRGSNGNLYLGTYRGVYHRSGIDDSWKPYHKTLPVCDVIKLKIDYKNNTLVAATFGRGIWMTKLVNNSNDDLKITYNKKFLKTKDTLNLVDYSVYKSDPVKYEWILSGPESFTSSEKHPSFKLIKKGIYDIKLTSTFSNNNSKSKLILNTISVK